MPYTPPTAGSSGWDGPLNAALAAIDASAQPYLGPTAVKTAAYTAAAGDLVLVDASSGPVTITLPTAAVTKAVIAVKKVDASYNPVTVAATASQTIGAAGATSTQVRLQDEVRAFQANGSNAWHMTYGHDSPSIGLVLTYTPVLSGQGSVTVSSTVGRWALLAPKLAWVQVQLTLGGTFPGTGSTDLTVSLPFTPDRTARQHIPLQYGDSGANAVANFIGEATVIPAGSGQMIDKLRVLNATASAANATTVTAARTWRNMVGTDLVSATGGPYLSFSGVLNLA